MMVLQFCEYTKIHWIVQKGELHGKWTISQVKQKNARNRSKGSTNLYQMAKEYHFIVGKTKQKLFYKYCVSPKVKFSLTYNIYFVPPQKKKKESGIIIRFSFC